MRISFYFHFILLEIMNKCIIWRWFGAVQYDCCIDCIAGSCNVVGYNKEAVHCPQHPSSRNNIHNARLLHPTVKRMRTLQHCTQAYKLQLKALILSMMLCTIDNVSPSIAKPPVSLNHDTMQISTYFVSSNFPKGLKQHETLDIMKQQILCCCKPLL